MKIIGQPFDEYSGISDKIAYLRETKTVKPLKIKDQLDSFLNRKFPRTVYWTVYEIDSKRSILKLWMDKYSVDFILAERSTDEKKKLAIYGKSLSDYVLGTRTPIGENIKGSSATDEENLAFAKAVLLRKPKEYKFVLLNDEEITKLERSS